MTGILALDWAAQTVSLFNTIILLWLGSTVLLNAERRSRGVWAAGIGLILGGVFFLSHSAILGLGLNILGLGVDLWWQVGLVAVLVLPYTWYSIILWYSGFWDDRNTALNLRHRMWYLALSTFMALVLLSYFFIDPLPTFEQALQLELPSTLTLGGYPLLILLFSPYLVFAMGLSLDVLRRPGPSMRVMGDVARQRARPWLIASSLVLLLVSLLVGLLISMYLMEVRWRPFTPLSITSLAWFDLVIGVLIAIAVVLTGQAVVSYEIFTGKTLPRGGLRRDWRRAVILATGYGILIGFSLSLGLQPIYGLLAATVLLTVFLALLSWRSYMEREAYINRLRPFVSSQKIYDQLLSSSEALPLDRVVSEPFEILCRDLLEVEVAYLVAHGPLAPFTGAPLVYPSDLKTAPPSLQGIVEKFDTPETLFAPIPPSDPCSARWAIPLWSTRGLLGVLLLGKKRDDRLYTEEEMAFARSVGERLIDLQATAEMARRLISLQRLRLTESRVLDNRAHQVLHDEVLPQLHAAMLTLDGVKSASDVIASDAIPILADAHRRISELLHEIPPKMAKDVSRLGLIGALEACVADEFQGAFDNVTWEIDPDASRKEETLSTLSKEVLYHAAREAIRNAASHGRGASKDVPFVLRISIFQSEGLEIVVEDNGIGFDPRQEVDQSAGKGLVLHSTMMAIIGGSLSIESVPDAFTRVRLRLADIPEMGVIPQVD
jgi:signal transduction histidine kinase